MKSAVIIDLDFTLSDAEDRRHFLDKKDYEGFHTHCGEDPVNEWCYELLLAMKGAGHKIILLTGRPRRFKQITKTWLVDKKVPYDKLIMKPDEIEDTVQAPDYKEMAYGRLIKPHYDVLFVVDDDMRVIKMFRELGVPALDCANDEGG